MAKVIMVQGTMSGVGKSLLTAGLCRIFRQDGYRVAPFKSQNMALNSFVTADELEMGRAQVMQAEAAGMEPMVCMNPILLKPVGHTVSQVIVNGEVFGNMSAAEYFGYRRKLIPEIKKAFRKLADLADIIVIEGAGSPAEINLKENDIVNMGLAEMVDAPVLLAGDIDRGGVFAQLLGTLMLLTEEEKKRVKGLIINKFRGDKTLLDPGIEMLREKGGVPVLGVVPYMDLLLEEEDSLTERFDKKAEGLIDIAVIRYPRISNFTDFDVFERIPGVSVRYVDCVRKLRRPDLIFLPGSKNTMGDLQWMRENGLEAAVKKLAEDVPVFGICGGYQMLGCALRDPDFVEEGGEMRGMELLPVMTVLRQTKTRCQAEGKIGQLEGALQGISGCPFRGYEIHMGETVFVGECRMDGVLIENKTEGKAATLDNQAKNGGTMTDGQTRNRAVISGDRKNVYGSYIHGLFDEGNTAALLVQALAERKGVQLEGGAVEDYQTFKQRQYDRLADTLRECLEMEAIYGMLREAGLE